MTLASKRRVAFLAAAAAAVLSTSRAGAAGPSGVWPLAGASLARTSLSTFPGPQTSEIAWRFDTNAFVAGGAAVDVDGALFFGNANGHLFAVEQSGQERWRRKSETPIVGVPAIGSDGRVYVGTTSGELLALDVRTGAAAWTFRALSSVTTSVAIGRDGTLYFGTNGKGLFAVDPNGHLRWSSALGKISGSAPAIGTDGTILVGTASGSLVALAPSGAIVWQTPIASGKALGSPALGNAGRAYVGSADGQVRAIDVTTGRVRWSFAADGAIAPGISIGPDGVVHFGTANALVYALRDDGTVATRLWSRRLGGAIASIAAVDREGAVYVGADDGTISALEGDDGSMRWSVQTGAPVRSAIAIGLGGRLFAGSNDRTLYAIGEFRAGQDCWSQAFLDPAGLSPDEANRRFHILLAACGGPDVDPCAAAVTGGVNADRLAAATRIVAGTIGPAEYLAILRDRHRKLRALADASGVEFCTIAAGDADGDLIPDARDRCPGTPFLTPTFDDGCTDPALPEAPSATLVRQFLDGVGLALDPNCGHTYPDAPVPAATHVEFIFGLPGQAIAPKQKSIEIAPSDNAPPACGTFYEFEIYFHDEAGALHLYYLVVPRSKGTPTAPGRLAFAFDRDDPDPYGSFVRSDALINGRTRIRVRATSYGGVRSVWGSL